MVSFFLLILVFCKSVNIYFHQIYKKKEIKYFDAHIFIEFAPHKVVLIFWFFIFLLMRLKVIYVIILDNNSFKNIKRAAFYTIFDINLVNFEYLESVIIMIRDIRERRVYYG